ncbi:MAG: TIGR04211 family SH3 domain-containing protein [Pseudomonadota bacterium]
MRRWSLLLCLVAGMMNVPALAQESVAYVTDVLRLGLHNAEDTSDRAFRTLESGQEMTVLERTRLYARIRLPDGTEGYVKAAYLVDDKPARLVVGETQAELATAQAELAEVRSEFGPSAARIAALEAELKEHADTDAVQSARVASLARENENYAQQLRLYSASLPWPHALGGCLVALALGFAAGFWWIDSRSRKRHGGFRIY